MDNLSPHLSYAEATHSNTAQSRGISNDPTPEHLEAMKALANAIFEPVRTHFGKPIRVNSMYRSKALNDAIGGSSSSQHCKGEAIDMDATSGFTNADIFHYIKDNLDFDQMIWEFGDSSNPDWVHVSYKAGGGNRKQMLTAYKDGGRSKYKPWEGASAPAAAPAPAPAASSGSGGPGGLPIGTVTASSLNVRSEPNGEKIGSFSSGTKVAILKTDGDWLHVTSDGTKGWVSAQYVQRS